MNKNIIKLTFGFLAVALMSLCGSAVSMAARPLQIIWDDNAHEGGAFSVEFSPDGQQLASGGAYVVQSGAELLYAENKLWAARTGALLAQTPRNQSLGATNEITFSPDGQMVATANGAVYCHPKGGCGSVTPGLADFSIPQFGQVNLRTTLPINATIDYSPDGTLLATGEFYGDYHIRIRNAADLSVIRTLPGHRTQYGDVGTFSVRFSPDGTLLASGGVDGNVKIWRVSDGTLLQTLPIGDSLFPKVFSVAFSPNGQFIAGGNEFGLRTIRVWQVSDYQLVQSFGFSGSVTGTPSQSNLAWTPDSKYLVGGRSAYDQQLNVQLLVRFWNVASGRLVLEATDNSERYIYSIAFTQNGHAFAYAASTDVVVARTPPLP
jgi:WD40 repeat protein